MIILTLLGQAKVAESIAQGTPISLTEMAVGDAVYTPSSGQTSLVNEQWRGALNTLYRDPSNPSYVVAEAVIPEDVGGWNVCEVGLFDSFGDLFAIGEYPLTYKPVMASGSGKSLYIRMIMDVSNQATVTLQIDPSVVLATVNELNDVKEDVKTSEIALSAVLRGNHVNFGCAPTDGGGLQVDYAAGEVNVAGTIYAITASNETCAASAVNWLYVDDTGSVVISTTPPTGDFAALAMIKTTVDDIFELVDLRNLEIPNLSADAVLSGAPVVVTLYSASGTPYYFKAYPAAT